MSILLQMFPQHVISSVDVPWRACPPDLSVCDCFWWGGDLKSNFFISKSGTMEELKQRIKEAIAESPSDDSSGDWKY